MQLSLASSPLDPAPAGTPPAGAPGLATTATAAAFARLFPDLGTAGPAPAVSTTPVGVQPPVAVPVSAAGPSANGLEAALNATPDAVDSTVAPDNGLTRPLKLRAAAEFPTDAMLITAWTPTAPAPTAPVPTPGLTEGGVEDSDAEHPSTAQFLSAGGDETNGAGQLDASAFGPESPRPYDRSSRVPSRAPTPGLVASIRRPNLPSAAESAQANTDDAARSFAIPGAVEESLVPLPSGTAADELALQSAALAPAPLLPRGGFIDRFERNVAAVYPTSVPFGSVDAMKEPMTPPISATAESASTPGLEVPSGVYGSRAARPDQAGPNTLARVLVPTTTTSAERDEVAFPDSRGSSSEFRIPLDFSPLKNSGAWQTDLPAAIGSESREATGENFAAPFTATPVRRGAGGMRPVKTFVAAGGTSVAEAQAGVGIRIAKPEAFMNSAPTLEPIRPATPPALERGEVFAMERLPDLPPVSERAPASAAQAVASVLAEADRMELRDRGTVKLQFSVGGADLAVHIEMRANEVRTTFRTDSPELQTALAREWQGVHADSTTRSIRLAEPVFATAGHHPNSFSGEQAPRQNSQRAPEENFPAPRSLRFNAPSLSATPVSTTGAVALPTSRLLHTLA